MPNKILVIFLSTFLCLSCVYAADNADLEKLSQEYFAKNDYDGFFKYVKEALAKKEVQKAEGNYYLALARQKNIEYWQEKKDWEGVYDKAEGFKKDIVSCLKESEGSVKDDTALLMEIKYLKWKRLSEDSPDSSAGVFNDLVNTAQQSEGSSRNLEVIQSIASDLAKLEDKNLSRRLYEIYADKLIKANSSPELLKENAKRFLSENNTYLSKTLFNAYLKSLKEDKILKAKETVQIANFFANDGSKEGIDPVFAEDLYKSAFSDAGVSAFDADSQYRRAFNLERMREYSAAAKEYSEFLNSFSSNSLKESVEFRLGVINAYVFKDIDTALSYFAKIIEENGSRSMVLSALYQSGLVSQHIGQSEKAGEFYKNLIDNATSRGLDVEKNELCLMAKDRMTEISEGKDIRYNLKIFLDLSLKKSDEKEPQAISPISVDLVAHPPKEKVGSSLRFVVTTSNPQTGCMTPAYSYEWSGETGSISNIPNSPEITTDYASDGIKVVNVVVVGPQGPEGAAFEMAEIE